MQNVLLEVTDIYCLSNVPYLIRCPVKIIPSPINCLYIYEADH